MKKILTILFIFIFHVTANNSHQKFVTPKKTEPEIKKTYTGIDISKYQKIN